MSDPQSRGRVDELIDRAIVALNRGDVDEAHALAGRVLAAERTNADATDLLAAQITDAGEVRRLTVMFSDLVGSTELSSRLEPEAYRAIVVRYQDACRAVVEDQYDGAIMSFRGDGILASFGFPVAHENDVDRAVLAGLDLIDAIEALSAELVAEGHAQLGVRVAVHKGLVFLDRRSAELYGFAVNVAARLESLADTGTLIISEEVQRLLRGRFDFEEHPPREVKGVDAPLVTFTVTAERSGASTTADIPLVGRQQERALLEYAWLSTRSGGRPHGGCVTISGEPGIGKSRLVTALCDHATSDGGQVVSLGGSPLHVDVGLWPFKKLVEDRCGIGRRTEAGERLERLRTTVELQGLPASAIPLLAALLGLDPSTGYAPEESDARRLRELVGGAALQFVESCFGQDGTLLVAEDLHWFDEESRAVIASIVHEGAPDVAVVITSRDQAILPRGEHVAEIQLQALAADHRIELLRHVVGAEPDDAALAGLAQRSDGIPLYLEELGRAAALRRMPDASGDLPAGTTVPEVLYEPLVARLQNDPNGVALAGVAATIGREGDQDLLARVCDLGADELESALDVMVQNRVLELGGDEKDRYRFRHELLRAVAYDLQPSARRRELHARIADALLDDASADDAVDWTVVAAHYETAGRIGQAAAAVDRAATVARRRGALTEARTLLTRAIDLVTAAPDLVESEVELRLRRGFLAVSLEGNSSAEAAVDYERCLELTVESTNSEGLFATLNALWSYYSAKGELDRATELLTVLGQHRGSLEQAAQFLAAAGLAMVASYRGDVPEGIRLAEQAVALTAGFDRTGPYARLWFVPLDPGASCHGILATGRMLAGDPQSAFRAFESCRGVCAALPFPEGAFTQAGYATFEVWLWSELGDFDGADARVAEVEELAAKHGFDQWAIVAVTQRAVVAGLRQVALGADADRTALSAHAAALASYLPMWKMVDQWVFVTYYTTIQALFHAAAGEVDEARTALNESLEISEWTGMGFYDVETKRHLANLEADSYERAAALRDALELARGQGAVVFELRAALDLHGLTGDVAPVADAVGRFAPSASYPELEAARKLVAGGSG